MASPSNLPPGTGNQARRLAVAEALENSPLLGPRLNETESCSYQVRMPRTGRSQKSKPFRPPAQLDDPRAGIQRRKNLKAEHIPATLIRIGSWEFASVYQADLVGKFYFATRKVIWEMLEDGMKKKIEIHWSDISAMKATFEENKPGILEIELDRPPSFYKETDPQPRHHSTWILADDFTGGQAFTCRRHYLEFPSEALEKSYIKLLSSDSRLLELSQRRFSSSVETTSCTSPQLNCDEYHPPLAISMPQAHEVPLQISYPPVWTPQQGRSYEAVIQGDLQWTDSTLPSVLDSQLLENHAFENSQMTPWDQLSHNCSQFNDLLGPCPAATASPAPNLGADLNSTYFGEAGVLPQQTPAIMRDTQRQLFSDPVSLYHPSLLPAVHSTFTSHIGLPSAVGSATNGNAMSVRQEQNGYAGTSREFIVGPLEHNGNFTSPIGMTSTVTSAYNGVAMGVRQEHDGYAYSSRQFNVCPSEQNGTFTSPRRSPSAAGSASNGNAMDGCANSNGQLIFGPSEQNGTFTSQMGSFPVSSASHGTAMGVGLEHNGYASSNGQFDFGSSEEEIYELLAPLMCHQDYERQPIGMTSAVGSANNGVAMGVRQEHDGYAYGSRQFNICPSEQNGTFTSPRGSPGAAGSASNGNAMDGCANSNGQLICGPSEQNGTFTSQMGSFPVSSASHGTAMDVGLEHNGYASSNGQFDFGSSVSEEEIYELLAPLMNHQDYERQPDSGSPWI